MGPGPVIRVPLATSCGKSLAGITNVTVYRRPVCTQPDTDTSTTSTEGSASSAAFTADASAATEMGAVTSSPTARVKVPDRPGDAGARVTSLRDGSAAPVELIGTRLRLMGRRSG